MKQKILAIFLSVVMLLGMLPASIIAGATDGETTDTTTDTTTESTTAADGAYTLLNVPDYNTKLTYKAGYINWPTRIGMYGDSTTDGNLSIDPIYNYTGKYDSSSGYLYVREHEGEHFIVLNPQETDYTQVAAPITNEYKTNSEVLSDETVTYEDEDKKVQTIVTKYTHSTTANGDYGKNNGSNIGINFNRISMMTKTDAVGLVNHETGTALLTADTVSTIKWMAMRIKVVGGEKGQYSEFTDQASPALYVQGAKLLDMDGNITETGWTDVHMSFTDEFDGWILVPFETADGADSRNTSARKRLLLDKQLIHYYFRCTETRGGKEVDWTNRTLLVGDIKVFADYDKFVAAHTPDSVETPAPVYDDTYNYKGIEGASYFMNLYDDIAAHPYLGYATLTYTNKELGYPSGSGIVCKGADGSYTGSSGSARLYLREFDGETFVEFDKNPAYGEANQNIYHNAINFNTTDHKSDGGFPAGVNTTELRSVAIRVKITEDTQLEDVVSIFSLRVQGGSNASMETNLSNAYLVDIANKQIIDPEWTSGGFRFNSAFDGWIIAPFEAWGTNGKTAFTTSTNIQYWLHGSSCDHGYTNSNWDNRILYIGDIIGLEDEDVFLCGIGVHETGEAVQAAAPSSENNGNMTYYICEKCNGKFADAAATTPVNPEYLVFDAASLTLEQNIAVNFKVNEANVEGFKNLYAKFNFDGKEKIVEAGDAVNGKYVFTLDNVGPHNLGKNITAQLFGTYEGTEYTGAEFDYSVKDYCYNKLEEYDNATDKDAFKTLLIDLLNYGAKAQTYSGTDTSALVNADLKHYAHQKVLASKVPTITGGTRAIYDDLADDTATWNGVNLYFEEVVGLKFRFTAPTTQGVTVKVTDAKDGGNLLAEISKFTAGANGSAVAYFNGLNATEMRKTVYVAVYKNGEKISDTLAYDILSYVNEKITNPNYYHVTTTTKTTVISTNKTTTKDTYNTDNYASTQQKNLATLVSYMLRYGDAAAAYAAANA